MIADCNNSNNIIATTLNTMRIDLLAMFANIIFLSLGKHVHFTVSQGFAFQGFPFAR